MRTHTCTRAINVRPLLAFSTLQHARMCTGNNGTVKESLANNQPRGGKMIALPMNEKKEAMNF